MTKSVIGWVLFLVLFTACAPELSAQIPQPLPPGPAQPRAVVVHSGDQAPPAEELPAPAVVPAPPVHVSPSPLTEPKPSPIPKPFVPKIDQLEVQRRLNRLKSEREGLKSERTSAVQTLEENEPSPEKMAQLRLRLGQLLGRLAVHPVPDKARAGPPISVTPPSIEPTRPSPPAGKSFSESESGTSPVDPLALGRTLFRAHDFAGALRAFRQVNLSGLKPEERRPVEYLMATCLKHLGKPDEAAAIYREVAGSKGDEVLAECAQWQLTTLRWQRDLEQQLRAPQQRLQELESLP